MELLDQYFDIQNKIYQHFGYSEDWRVIPLDDARAYFWRCDGEEVEFADTLEELQSQDGNYYVHEVYKQRFLPQWVYESEGYTMICVDTHVDGNKFLQVFDNSNRQEVCHDGVA